MELSQFNEAKINNSKIMQHCLATRTTDLSNIIFWEGVVGKELGFDELASKWADVIGCSVIGALPSIERSGADGYIYYRDDINPREVETKICGVRHSELAVGQKGGLYYSTNLENYKSKSAITSKFLGQFKPMAADTMQSKKRDTFLILFDKTENKIIGANRIEAEKVLSLLYTRGKNNKTITLKLGTFHKHGHTMETQWEVETFDIWKDRMITQTKAARRFIIAK